MNDGAGATATDFSGNKNNGTLTNMDPSTDWVNGRHGKALDFDGTNDYVTATRPSQITSSGAATVSMWAKLDQTPALVNLFNISDGTNTILVGYWWNSGNGFILRSGTVTTNITTLSANPDITKWHYWVFTRTDASSQAKIYVDGIDRTGSPTSSLGDVDVDAFELSRGLDGAYQSKMTVDDVRIYNRALSAAEVAALYQAGQVSQRNPNNLGLVGYWSMNDGATATTTDSSGLGNHGGLINMDPSTDWVNGRHGKALDFDASNDYVFLGSSLYDSHQQGSVAAWIKFYGGGNYFFSAASYTSSAYVLAFNIITISGSPRLRINELNGDYVYANQGLSPGRWYFVTVTSNGSTWKIYIDGVEQSLSVQLGSNTGEWFGDEAAGGGSLRYDIGVLARSSGLSGYFNGLIDDVRIYNRALSAAEVRALYQAGQVAQRNPNNLGLVGYWSMNDGAGATATDFSGNKNQGTLTNMDPSTDWVNGRHGKALDFDGSNDYADAGTNSSLAINQGALTISAWFKLNGDYTTAQAIIANAISGNGNANYALTFGFTDNKIEYWPNSSGPIFTSNLSISDNAWYHVVMVRDGSDNNWTGWMYIDGKLDKTSTFLGSSNNPASPTTAIGRFGAFNGYYWNGRLDDVRVYNRTLSAAEVRALYDSR